MHANTPEQVVNHRILTKMMRQDGVVDDVGDENPKKMRLQNICDAID
jgi:hypothetical protein